MIDFHSHILPQVDDGAADLSESLAMLRQSFLQGVDLIVSTSHFYPDQEYPRAFLLRRNAALRQLREAMLLSTEVYPRVAVGAEVLYFPGISEAEAMDAMRIGPRGPILIEPPMARWSDSMLDEIRALGDRLGCTPVIAHVDRYMQQLKDPSLMDRVRARDMAVQVNAEYFLNPKTAKAAMKHLKNGQIQLIGSDCHNLTSRPPNLGAVRRQMKALGAEDAFRSLRKNAQTLLIKGRLP